MTSPVVLIVEDIAQVRGLLIATLEPEYRCIEASTSQEALTRIEALRQAQDAIPDLIILDLTLPDSEMTGLEFCTHIKSQETTRHIPVVILTGAATVRAVAEAMAAGAAKFISKPYSAIDLLDTLARLTKAAE